MTFGDVTRAILRALVEIHPRGVHAQALACMVDCEERALIKELRLLHAVGAIEDAAESGEVRVTDATWARWRRGRGEAPPARPPGPPELIVSEALTGYVARLRESPTRASAFHVLHAAALDRTLSPQHREHLGALWAETKDGLRKRDERHVQLACEECRWVVGRHLDDAVD